MTIERHNRCRGIRLAIGKWQAEIWFVPMGEKIAAHVHEKIHSRIIQLWGRASWTVNRKKREVFGPFRRRESNGKFAIAAADIPAGVRHAAEAKSFCVFLNLEKCEGMPMSASKDFVRVP